MSTGETLGRGDPVVEDGSVPARLHDPERRERRRRGAYFTPPSLVDVLVHDVLEPACAGRSTPPRILDPACGDGRLLEAAGSYLTERFGVDSAPFLVGVELDADEARSTASRVRAQVLCGDARSLLDTPEHRHAYDIVIGNPPYLSQLSAETARGGRSHLGGGPYADVAAEFLALSLRLVHERDGFIGLVLPLSVLASRHVAPIRAEVEQCAAIESFWWSNTQMFEANVRTCVLGLRTGRRTTTVRRTFGGVSSSDSVPTIGPPEDGSGSDSWSWLVADIAGVPRLPTLRTVGVLADLATATADFRDQYYGLVGCVADEGDGPPLVTSGLIDVGCVRWGEKPTVFAKQRYSAPRVQIDRLDERMHRWATARLVPKVLVASQTRVIEAAVDEQGLWLPSVPVVTMVPLQRHDLWRVAAVLTSPIASAWIAHRRTGSGLSARSIRVTASDLHALPLPGVASAWETAVERLRAGDVLGSGESMMDAYGCDDAALFAWWGQRVG